MNLKPRLESQLKQSRDFSEGLLTAFESPEQWTRQLFPGANHALWFAGHMSLVDNFIISLLAPEKAQEKPGFSEKFGMGSKPTGTPADYPPPAEVLAHMRERRQALLGILAGLSEQDLEKPKKPGGPPFLTDIGSYFEMAIWHEGMHSGQVTMTRRALGNAPVFG